MHGPRWWRDRFHDHGARYTSTREIILGVLQAAEGHLSAADVYVKAHSLNPGIGLTTVYRTLDMLVRMGMVRKFEFGDGKARFEMADARGDRDHHHHLVCMSCRKIIDYSDFVDEELEFIRKTEKALERKYNFSITGHMIRFQGLCADCRSKR